MKADIHPKYYPEAKVTCSCGNSWITGSTKPELRVELCSACHPFYTGQQRIVDTAGQVERFRRRFGLGAPADETGSAAETAEASSDNEVSVSAEASDE